MAFGQELSDTSVGNVWYSQYCAQKGLGEILLFTSCVSLSCTDAFTFIPMIRNDLSVRGFFPTGHIPDCPKLPENLNVDGRDVSADERFRSFISDTRLSAAET